MARPISRSEFIHKIKYGLIYWAIQKKLKDAEDIYQME